MLRRCIAPLVLAFVLAATATADIQNITAEEAHLRVQRGELVLLDVRTPTEWAVTGLPQDSIGATLQNRDFLLQVYGAVLGDPDRPVALICRTGERSEKAAKRLEAEGFTQIFDVSEGMAGRDGAGIGWLKHELPTYNYIPRQR